MDRIVQTAIMVAAIGAVTVTAGAVISFQTELENAENSKNAQLHEAPEISTAAAIETATDVTEDEIIEDELDLSEFGKPTYDTSLFTADSEPANIDENAAPGVNDDSAETVLEAPTDEAASDANTAPEANTQDDTNAQQSGDILQETGALEGVAAPTP